VLSAELLDGARNLLIDYAKISPEEEVVILSEVDAGVEEAVVDAELTVLHGAGVKAHSLWTPLMRDSWWQDLSPVVRGAIAAADVVVQNMVVIGKTHMLDLMLEKKVRRIRNYATRVDLMSSDWARFPIELQDILELRVNTLLQEARSFRVVTPDGTDIAGEVAPRLRAWRTDVKRSGGMNVTFPPGVFRSSETEHANGVIMVNGTYPWGARRVGLPESRFTEPVRLTIEDNYVVNVEGGDSAARYRRLLEQQAEMLGRQAYKLDSYHSGTSPRAFAPFPAYEDPVRFDHLLHGHEGWFHFHVGSLSDKNPGSSQRVEHVNATLHTQPTVYLDGEIVWSSGRLAIWEDPEILEVAAKYGDPQALLAQREIRF
jgi:hypothetical protein